MGSSARVMDVIHCRDSWIRRHPEWAARGEGLLAILEPREVTEVPDVEGRAVTVTRPDGGAARVVVERVEVGRGGVALFFKGASPADAPRGSLVEW